MHDAPLPAQMPTERIKLILVILLGRMTFSTAGVGDVGIGGGAAGDGSHYDDVSSWQFQRPFLMHTTSAAVVVFETLKPPPRGVFTQPQLSSCGMPPVAIS